MGNRSKREHQAVRASHGPVAAPDASSPSGALAAICLVKAIWAEEDAKGGAPCGTRCGSIDVPGSILRSKRDERAWTCLLKPRVRRVLRDGRTAWLCASCAIRLERGGEVR